MKTQQGFFGVGIIIAIVLGLIVVGGGAYVYVKNQQLCESSNDGECHPYIQYQATSTAQTSNPTPKSQTTSPSPAADSTANWKTYRNEKFSFELRYPSDLKVEQQSGSNPSIGEDWVTVAFKNDSAFSLTFFVGVRPKGAPGEGYDNPQIKKIIVAGKQVDEALYLSEDESQKSLLIIWIQHSPDRADFFYSYFMKSQAATFVPKIEAIVATLKYTDSAPSVSAVQKINWSIEKANPAIVDDNDYRKSEQAIAVDVTLADNSTKRYSLGTAYGCTGSNVESTQDGKKILGKVNCYFALTGVGFVAYTQNGRFVVERHDESAKDGSIKTTVLLEI